MKPLPCFSANVFRVSQETKLYNDEDVIKVLRVVLGTAQSLGEAWVLLGTEQVSGTGCNGALLVCLRLPATW